MGQGHVVHRAVRSRPENVIIAVFLKDPRRSATTEHNDRFQLIRDGCNGQTIARPVIANNGVDLFALHQITKPLDLNLCATGLINLDDFDGHPPKADHASVGCRNFARVQRVDHQHPAIHRRHAKCVSTGPRQEVNHPQLECLACLDSGCGNNTRHRCKAGRVQS